MVCNYGIRGSGFITLSTDGAVGASPNMTMAVHQGSTSFSVYSRIGNLNGSYGYGTNIFGAAFGQYKNDLSFITIDDTNGIRIMSKPAGVDTMVAQWSTAGHLYLGQQAVSGQSNIWLSNTGIVFQTYVSTAYIQHINMNADGDIFIGYNLAYASSTGLSIFSNAQTYNGEAVTAGDILIGDNTAANANILWDYSASSLLFRAGTVKHIDLQSDGDIFIGTNTAAVATTFFSLFTAAQTYNGEAMTSGDLLIGDNSAGVGNVLWDASANSLVIRTGTTKKIELQTDGDIFIGSDTSAAATTNLAIFSNAVSQTYNGETGFETGDILIGYNSARYANIKWDKSTGELLFRGGTSMTMKITATGALVAGTYDAGMGMYPTHARTAMASCTQVRCHWLRNLFAYHLCLEYWRESPHLPLLFRRWAVEPAQDRRKSQRNK